MSTESLTTAIQDDDADQSVEQGSGARGPRAVFVLAGVCSLLICAAAVVWWLWRLATGGPGYNSALTAVYALTHAAVAGYGILLTRTKGAGWMGSRGASWLAGMMLVATPLVYAELALAIVNPRIPTRETPYVPDREAEWRMKANYEGEYTRVPLRTNSEGFRSPEISPVKPEGTVRVICLGDSLTFGHGVEERFAYPRALERVLRERFPQRGWEVVNTGVEGYSTFQETVQLQRCLKYQPDLVVLLFCMNDVTEKYVRVRAFGGTGLGYHGVADGAAGRMFKLLVAARPYSAMAKFLTPTRNQAERRQSYAVMKLWEEPDAPAIQQAWEQTEKELDELVDYCAEHRLGLLLAVAPFATQPEAGAAADAPQRRLERYAARRGVAFVDLWPGLDARARQMGKTLRDLFLDRSHFTETGNQVIADLIAERFALPAAGDGNLWSQVVEDRVGSAAAARP